jgi:hypothetical protein
MPGAALAPNAGIPFGAGKRAPRAARAADRLAAGVLFVTPDGDGLFIKRKGADHAGKWSIPAGHVEDGEDFATAARRESAEEVGRVPNDIRPLHRGKSGRIDFATFQHDVKDRFDPKLNDESEEYVWAPIKDPPQPLHPGLAKVLAEFFKEEAEEPEHEHAGAARELEGEFEHEAEASDSLPECLAGDSLLAFDKESVRSFDQDGRMKVDVSNISKAQIRPYKGSEIPGWEELGLDKDKIYKMLCPPEELEKAAETFNGVQILQQHVPVDADDHRAWDIVGTTGSEARFEAPYLKNSLFIWAQKGIDFIESEKQRELSCGYHYDPEIVSGSFEGEKYDGIMRNIRGNHLALVAEGRAGSDVMVADSVEELQWQAIEEALLELV